MHDPLVVAFEIKSLWPRWGRSLKRYRRRPPIVTVWHREPHGYDSGEVCKHYVYKRDGDWVWRPRVSNLWRLHVHHWRIQVHALQALRRSLLTRCAWCQGRHKKRDPVDNSHSWDGPRGRWWQGEPGLFHRECSTFAAVHEACVCELPDLAHGTYGHCSRCGRDRSFGRTEQQVGYDRIMASVRQGHRDLVTYDRVRAMRAVDEATSDWEAARFWEKASSSEDTVAQRKDNDE